jgi:site-specific DNA-cytosine methylase
MGESVTDLVLFSGMGGTSDGLVKAGWKVGLCVDYWDKACVAHQRWHPTIPVAQARCEQLPISGPVRLVWASPSCKPWSTANRTPLRGKAHPEYFSLAGLVRQVFGDYHAQWLVIENVGGLIWSREGVIEVAELRAEVARMGLALSQPKNGVIASNTLGVAQLRRRVFLIVGPRLVSIRPGSELLPAAGVPPMLWETAEVPHGQAIMACEGTKGSWEAESRWPKRAEAETVLRGDCGPGKDHNWKRAAAGVVADEWGRVNGAVRLKQHRAERTAILTDDHPNKWATEYSAAPQKTGRSLAECAALQMVPLEPLAGFSKRDSHALVGNAVPPPVAEHIGRIDLDALAFRSVPPLQTVGVPRTLGDADVFGANSGLDGPPREER